MGRRPASDFLLAHVLVSLTAQRYRSLPHSLVEHKQVAARGCQAGDGAKIYLRGTSAPPVQTEHQLHPQDLSNQHAHSRDHKQDAEGPLPAIRIHPLSHPHPLTAPSVLSAAPAACTHPSQAPWPHHTSSRHPYPAPHHTLASCPHAPCRQDLQGAPGVPDPAA